jgi:plasmid stabilization system protein ParE
MATRSRQERELGSGTTQDHRHVSSYRLRIDPLAEDDLSRAYRWYERQRPDLGGEFLNSVDKCFRRIVENPAAFQMVRKAARRALLARFPYCVLHRRGMGRGHSRVPPWAQESVPLGTPQLITRCFDIFRPDGKCSRY